VDARVTVVPSVFLYAVSTIPFGTVVDVIFNVLGELEAVNDHA
jgi:hypothetical protein